MSDFITNHVHDIAILFELQIEEVLKVNKLEHGFCRI
jgi:hypothetical protein